MSFRWCQVGSRQPRTEFMTLTIFPTVQGLRVDEIPLAHIGPLFERNPVFPAGINTEFVEVVSRTRLKMRVWERGAGMSPLFGTCSIWRLVFKGWNLQKALGDWAVCKAPFFHFSRCSLFILCLVCLLHQIAYQTHAKKCSAPPLAMNLGCV